MGIPPMAWPWSRMAGAEHAILHRYGLPAALTSHHACLRCQVMKLHRDVFTFLLGSLESIKSVWRYEALRTVRQRRA